MNRADTAARYGDTRRFLNSTLITLILGTLFLIGVVGVEWQIAHFGPADGPVGSLFYAMTGFHALHVLTGVIFLGVIYRNGRKGMYTPERHWPVEAAASLLALRGCGLDLLLPGPVPDRCRDFVKHLRRKPGFRQLG
jgi:cytochrome c oxidase subunit III